jgi:transposase
MWSIGLDVHQSRTSVCVLDGQGNTVRQQEIKGGYEAVAQTLAGFREPFQVCYEASTGYGALYDRLTPVAARVLVAHPGRLGLIFKSKKKHNRADAAKLAALLHLNQVPQVHVPRQEVRSWRGLIEHRGRAVARGVALKNQIRALLRGVGIRGLPGKRQWSQSGLRWLREVPWPTTIESLRLEVLLDELEFVQGRIEKLTALLEEIVAKDPRVALLESVPGVGPRTAEAFVAYVDDPGRFTAGTIGAYFGLVPREDSTGEHRRLGHITREGPGSVRKLLVECVWRGKRDSPRVNAVYQRLLQGDPGRRKRAVVATAHWLCRVMLALLKSGQAYVEAAVVATDTPAPQTPAKKH